jgi:hypothetical protein
MSGVGRMLRNDSTLQQWLTVYVTLQSSCSIEVQVQKLLYCFFVAESIEDRDSVQTFVVAISQDNITSDVLGNAERLWAMLQLSGPIQKLHVKQSVRLFAKRWKASKLDFSMQGCPASDTLPGLVGNAYFHMYKKGMDWVEKSRGMAQGICKIWTSQSLCLTAFRMHATYLTASPAAVHECVKILLWVYMTVTVVPAAIMTTIFANVRNMVCTCDNVIHACIFMSNQAMFGDLLPGISQVANDFRNGLNAQGTIPSATESIIRSRRDTRLVDFVDFVWQACCAILEHAGDGSTMLSTYTNGILSIWNSRLESPMTAEATACASEQFAARGAGSSHEGVILSQLSTNTTAQAEIVRARPVESSTPDGGRAAVTNVEPTMNGKGHAETAFGEPATVEARSRKTRRPRPQLSKEAAWEGRL